MKRYIFAIQIIEEDSEKCTKIYKKTAVGKLAFIKTYMDALIAYRHATESSNTKPNPIDNEG